VNDTSAVVRAGDVAGLKPGAKEVEEGLERKDIV